MRCPYTAICGPDTEKYYDTDRDETDAREFCLTGEHFNCPEYEREKAQEIADKKRGFIARLIFGEES